MNNKEKRQYMSNLMLAQSPMFLEDFNSRKEILNKRPKILYKYRSFDQYAFEMIEQEYAYLAPVKELDDPFDCLNDFSVSTFINPYTGALTKEGFDYIVNKNVFNLDEQQKKCLFEAAKESNITTGVDYNKLIDLSKTYSPFLVNNITAAINTLENIQGSYQEMLDSKEMKTVANKAYSPGDTVGVCSLTEEKDNKVMWSLYSDKYQGYCIEYEIPLIKELILNLCPVIYTKNISNFTEKVFDACFGSLLHTFSNGAMKNDLGAAMELFCTKDTDWKYQKEWRVIGGAGDPCKLLKIKAIYLGFKVSEENETEMKNRAKKYKFKLYKMNPPNGKKKIEYTPIFIPD